MVDIVIGWPQAIWIALVCMSLGLNLAKHGEPRTTPYSFGTSLFAAAIGFCLLYWGGFFS